jgi:hypothetical protein
VAVAPKQTDAAALGARDGFGVAADPDNPADLVAIVRTLLADPGRLAAMGVAARVAARQYARAEECLKFAQVLEQVHRPLHR